MNSEDTWASCGWPFNSPSFDTEIRPPVEVVWSHTITNTYGDGSLVGGKGRLYVPVRGTCVQCLDLADGRVIWDRRCRRSESDCFLAGGFLWTEKSGYSNHRIELNRVQLEDGDFETFTLGSASPMGVFWVDGHSRLRLDNCIVPTDVPSAEEERPPFYGRLHDGRAYGRFGEIEICCHDARSGDVIWQVATDLDREDVMVADEDVVVSFVPSGLRVRSEDSGDRLWSVDGEPDACTPCLTESHIIRTSTRGQVFCHRKRTGEIAWQTDPEKYWACTNILRAGRTAWVGAEEIARGRRGPGSGRFRLLGLDVSNGKQLQALRLERSFPAVQSLFVIDDRLVVRCGRKILCFESKRARNSLSTPT